MRRDRSIAAAALVGAAVVALGGSPASAQQGATNGEWRSYGGDLGGTKYSALDQITGDNFSRLEIAWRWTSADGFLGVTDSTGGEWRADATTVFAELLRVNSRRWRLVDDRPSLSNFEATPLMINGILYLNTPLSQGAAIDARTGRTLWVYNPKSYEEGSTSNPGASFVQRGVAYWTDGRQERIFWGTGNYYLICVEAKTGRPCHGFGNGGRVDLMDGLPRVSRGERDYLNALPISVQSPPIVVRDVVIVGSSIGDRKIRQEAVPGWVRAFDARTGAHKWDFHTVPQAGEEGVETWLGDSWRYTGNANVWAPMSADPGLGYVYLPTSTPTNDYYGGHRLGDNLFAESLVCLDVETGKKVWHFQAVHHGLWDWDFPTHPNLLDVIVNGRAVKAVAQVSKQAFVYVFDRVTGEPIWPIEERQVPTETNLDGERPSRTQPFPSKPPPFDYQGVAIDDLVDFTPELRQMALEAIKDFRIGPIFTPPTRGESHGTKGTIFRPSAGGGASWSGAAVDPDTGWLYVPSRNAFSVIAYYNPESIGGNLRYTHGAPEEVRRSADYQEPRPLMPQGLPLFRPPYSRMTAIDLRTGEHAWMVPTGNGDRIRRHPMLRDLNLPPLGGDGGRGGPLLTKTLLIYALTSGGRDGGPSLAAYDKVTGVLVASVDLPAGAIGTPMTYSLDGRQYIALTVGGPVPELIVFTLPE